MDYIRKTTDIFVSDELKEVLLKIQKSSEVARLLLKQRHKNEILVDNHVNYISISEKDSTKISYISKERMEKCDDPWDSKKRFLIKPGSFVKKIFKDISNKEVEIFSNAYKNAQTKQENGFTIVDKQDIIKYYNKDSYESDNSSLGSSCMKYDKCGKYLKMYLDNPDKVKMVILLNEDGELLARALLWYTDSGEKVMDRVYSVNDEKYVYQFRKWASENGYKHKKEQRWNNSLYFQKNDEVELLKLSVKLDKFEYEYHPYLDTFKFFDNENGILYNHIPDNYNVTLCCPDGGYYGKDTLVLDGIEDVYYRSGDVSYVEYLGFSTYCGNLHWSDINNTYIHKDHCTYNDRINDYVFIDDTKNNTDRINKKLEELKELREKREKRNIEERTYSISPTSYFIQRFLESDALIFRSNTEYTD